MTTYLECRLRRAFVALHGKCSPVVASGVHAMWWTVLEKEMNHEIWGHMPYCKIIPTRCMGHKLVERSSGPQRCEHCVGVVRLSDAPACAGSVFAVLVDRFRGAEVG